MRTTIILILIPIMLLSACVRLRSVIASPVHDTLEYSASPAEMAKCTQDAVRTRRKDEPGRIILWHNPTTRADEGITHVAFVFRPRDDGGTVDFHKLPARQPMTKAMSERFWGPVQRCARQLG